MEKVKKRKQFLKKKEINFTTQCVMGECLCWPKIHTWKLQLLMWLEPEGGA
jgi:hypothetical protein